MSELSNKIYEQIQKQIQTVTEKLMEEQLDARLAEDISDAMENLNLLNSHIQAELEKLKENSEWKRFTIAFYGETNAGKSTLIEALRLYLGEKTKKESQKKFKEIQQQLGLTQEAFDKVRHVIMETTKAIEEVQQETIELSKKYAESIIQAELIIRQTEEKHSQESKILVAQHKKAISKIESEIFNLSELLAKLKAEQTWIQKIIAYFSKPHEEKQLIELKSHCSQVKKQQQIDLQECLQRQQQEKQQATMTLEQLQEKKQQELTLLSQKEQELQQKQQQAEQEKKRLDNDAKTLANFADGKIIGDGRSDFTRHNTSFDFDVDGQAFSLIDVPGIEGDETIVSTPIEEAVRKAHAVFYVTRTARPPQTSDGEQVTTKGTLEKIKKHLGAQSEVWSIYNHPANSPRQLTSPLLNEDNRNSLMAMDEKLKAELREQYYGSLVVSARPAYLTLTECIVPGSKESREQKKFLDKFGDPKTILSLSGITDFVIHLKTTIIGDYRNKIKQSNLNKAYKTLKDALTDLQNLQTEFANLNKNIKSEVSNAKSKINVALEEFIGTLNAKGSKICRNFHDHVQTHIYEKINNDISNDEFKQDLKSALEQKAITIQSDLKHAIENEANIFSEKIKNIIDRSSQHLKNIVTKQNNNLNFQQDFKFNINIDNGLQISGLIASGIGGALGIAYLATNPVGWTIAFVGGAIALVGSLVGLAKSIWGFFDSSYKKSQQRKEVNNILRNANGTIEKEINKIIGEIEQEMRVEVQKIQSELELPVKQCTAINNSLKQANTELMTIANHIKY
ncbi:TPA: GTPase [Proteus mirabilis]|nr:50S ribosome-binding GTPase [Proteus mirabilis]